MMKEEKMLALMKEAGLDEKKFQSLLLKEDPTLVQMRDQDLDQVSGGGLVDLLNLIWKRNI